MNALRSTVVMKTDICEFTPYTRTLSEAELSLLLNQQKALISDIAPRRGGVIVKGEGDSFWLVFPSVTAAALAAVELQQELRVTQSGLPEEKRLAQRVVITLGDVLHQNNDIFGEVVNLAARIESVTPKDEIYLSQSAWLALNQNEVDSSYVNDFTLKGISEPVKVYRIEQKHQTRIIKNQIICGTDISGFHRFYAAHAMEDSENLLLFLDDMSRDACEKHGGDIRFVMADGHIMTFPQAESALAAMNELCATWMDHVRKHTIPCGLHIGVHRGDLNIFRSHLYGNDFAITMTYSDLGLSKLGNVFVVTDNDIFNSVQSSEWRDRLAHLEKNLYYLQV
jgi:class 3 adenylate cyclase